MKNVNLTQLQYITGGCSDDNPHEVCPFDNSEDADTSNSNSKPYNRKNKQSKSLYERFMEGFSGFIKF